MRTIQSSRHRAERRIEAHGRWHHRWRCGGGRNRRLLADEERERPATRRSMFRVRFDGDDLDDTATAALLAADAWWEGTERGPSGPCHHRALVEAETEAEA